MIDESYLSYTISGGGPVGYPSDVDECYARLAAAVIKQAAMDYEATLIALFKRPVGMKRILLEADKSDLEMFFHASWYETLTDIDGDKLIEATKRHAVEKAKKAIRKQQEKKLKSMCH